MAYAAVASSFVMAILRIAIVSRLKALGLWRRLGQPSELLYYDAYIVRFPFLRDPRFTRWDRIMLVAYPILGVYALGFLLYAVWTGIFFPS